MNDIVVIRPNLILGLSRKKDLVKSVTLDIMSQQSSNDVALGLEMNL